MLAIPRPAVGRGSLFATAIAVDRLLSRCTMSNLQPEKALLLERAAELRAAGSPWTAVATELKVAADDLRTLRQSNTRLFDRLVRRADRESAADTLRATFARLRELLKSTNEKIAMLAAGTIIRFELARMRQSLQARRNALERWGERNRDELPPLPSRRLGVEKLGCDRLGSQPKRSEEVPAQQAVATQAPAKSTTWDSMPVTGVTGAKLASASPAVNRAECAQKPPLLQSPPAAPPGAAKGKSSVTEALRRKKWLPPGLSP